MKTPSRSLHRPTGLLVAALVSACTQTQAPTPPPRPPPERVSVLSAPLPPMPEGHPDLGGLKVLSPALRRLSIDQVEASLDSVASLPPGSVKLPAQLAVTLGQPDYLRVTEENLEPSPLFIKFLGDIAASACVSLSDAEPSRPQAQRLMTRFATRDENLKFMLLRFTGLEGAAAQPYLARLEAVHSAASVSARPRAGYEAACISLITSPEFLLY